MKKQLIIIIGLIVLVLFLLCPSLWYANLLNEKSESENQFYADLKADGNSIAEVIWKHYAEKNGTLKI